MDFVVGCPTDGTLVLKTTYHPGWHVSVDGQPVEAYMVSPSYIGVDLTAGRHQVTAEYRPDPLKLPLLLIGLACCCSWSSPVRAWTRRSPRSPAGCRSPT